MPRTLLIQVKVDESEKAQIAEVAERAGMAPSAFLRYVGLSEHRLQSKPDFDSPIPRETLKDQEDKAKVRQAVENEESYEVKIEPGTISPEEELRAKAMELVRTKGLSYRVARARIDREFSDRPNVGRS